jgi:NAD(P)H-hydrate epimerase
MKTATLSVSQSRELDKKAEKQFGIPSLILMENAGRGIADFAYQMLSRPTNLSAVFIMAGIGNNGGDALVAARHLFQKDIIPSIYLCGDPTKFPTDASINFRIIQKLGLEIFSIDKFSESLKKQGNQDLLIIDGLLGTGFVPPLRYPIDEAIRQMNKAKIDNPRSVKILSIDIPSGLSGDKGPVGEEIVRADLTVTFACYKPGLLKMASRSFVGQLEVLDIGIPKNIFQKT